MWKRYSPFSRFSEEIILKIITVVIIIKYKVVDYLNEGCDDGMGWGMVSSTILPSSPGLGKAREAEWCGLFQ